MIAMLVMQMAGNDVVNVVSVRDGLMTAGGAVFVTLLVGIAAVIRCTAVRVAVADTDAVLVDVIVVDVMKMAVVQVIDVAVMFDSGVAAMRSMSVGVTLVSPMFWSHKWLDVRRRSASSCNR